MYFANALPAEIAIRNLPETILSQAIVLAKEESQLPSYQLKVERLGRLARMDGEIGRVVFEDSLLHGIVPYADDAPARYPRNDSRW